MDYFEPSLVREQTTRGVAERLCAWACGYSGAIQALLWLDAGDGRLAVVNGVSPACDRASLGFGVLPVMGAAADAPAPWTGRLAFIAVAVPASEGGGVLALGFDAAPPASLVSDAKFQARVAFAGALLERNTLRAALANAQQEAVARVGAGLAHTLGNVLQAALSSVEAARGGDPATAQSALVEASGSLRRASAITRQLATIAGTGGEREPTEVRALVSSVVASLADQMPAGVTLGTDRSAVEGWAELDAGEIESSLACLIHEAREALGAAGEINVSVRHRATPARWIEIEVRYGTQISLDVCATMPHVAAAVAPDNGGGDTVGAAQLRLAMVRAVAHRHGGFVTRHTAPDGGSTVLRLQAVSPRAAGSTVPRLSVQRRLHVLLADDEPSVLRGVQRVLASAGHTIHPARDGAEAVALARANAGINVALVDLTMPELSGPSLVAALGRVAPGVPVIVMTGYASNEMERALRREGAVAVLRKPVSGPKLLEAVALAALGDTRGDAAPRQ